MRPLIANETRNIIEHLASNVKQTDLTDILYCRWSSGCDASGRHSVYRSCKSDAGIDNRNYIFGGMRNISIHNERNELLYEEKSMSGSTELPQYLIPGKETLDLTTKILTKHQDEIKDVQTNHVESEILGKKVTLIPKVEFSQADGSILKKASRLAGHIFFYSSSSFPKSGPLFQF